MIGKGDSCDGRASRGTARDDGRVLGEEQPHLGTRGDQLKCHCCLQVRLDECAAPHAGKRVKPRIFGVQL